MQRNKAKPEKKKLGQKNQKHLQNLLKLQEKSPSSSLKDFLSSLQNKYYS